VCGTLLLANILDAEPLRQRRVVIERIYAPEESNIIMMRASMQNGPGGTRPDLLVLQVPALHVVPTWHAIVTV
jgi:hypothetical protein